ncbi:MAG: 4Fe-4S cluster-binding domain-containing protein [Clostridiales bacterium]|nr:4Fe-4S cluster-binding domain-containing protein [Clostridiales bacterium]
MEYFTYLTNDCNLHCQYCSVLVDCQKNKLPVRPTYALEDYLEFIEQMQYKANDSEISVYFFGGEPSLEYDSAYQLAESIINKFGEKYKTNFILHTNGLLLGEIPAQLRNVLSLIMLSINYEKIPKYNLGGSYFQTITDNAVGIKLEKNIPIIARLTITETTSIYTEIMQISHFFDLVYWQIENCFSFKDFNAFYKSYTYEINLLYSIWLKYFESGTMLKFVPFMAVLKFIFFHDRSDNIFSCGYGRGMVYIQTNGNCYACSDNIEDGKHYIGTLKTGIKLGNYTLDKFRCAECGYRSLCMGRCGRMHIEFEDEHIREYCKLNQFMFDLFVSDKQRLGKALEKYKYYKEELSGYLLEYTEFTP